MQPLFEVTLTRPWHWGIAVLGDATAEAPTDFAGQLVATANDVVAIRVRHAQDVEAGKFEGDWDWATATLHLRGLAQPQVTGRQVLCDVVLGTAQEVLSVGDADEIFVVPTPGARTRLIVTADATPATGLERVWVDLVATSD